MFTFVLAEPESSFTGALPATLLHGALLAGAIWASGAGVAAITDDPVEVSIAWQVQTTTHQTVTTTTLPGIPVIGTSVIPDLPTVDPFAPIPGTTVDPRQFTADSTPKTSFLPGGDPGQVVGVYRDTEVDELPSLLAGGRLRYPTALAAAGMEGSVTLAFVIDVEGRVEAEGIELISASHAGFVPAAKEGVITSRFRPARKGGVAVRVRVRQMVTFRR